MAKIFDRSSVPEPKKPTSRLNQPVEFAAVLGGEVPEVMPPPDLSRLPVELSSATKLIPDLSHLDRIKRRPVDVLVRELFSEMALTPKDVNEPDAEGRLRHFFKRVVAYEELDKRLDEVGHLAIEMAWSREMATVYGSFNRQIVRVVRPEGLDTVGVHEILHVGRRIRSRERDSQKADAKLFEYLCHLAKIPAQAKVETSQSPAALGFMLEDDRILLRDGKRYFPISLAAGVAQVPRTTLQTWIAATVEFQGRTLDTYRSPTAHRTYLTEESVQRVANRFVRWPSKEPAGKIHIGQTREATGYLGITKAARAINVDSHTIWLWITNDKAPIGRSLDVIRCSASEQFYVSERDVVEIKNLPQKPGLRRGRFTRVLSRPG